MPSPTYSPYQNKLSRFLFILAICWASPYSLFGMLVGLIGCLTGGKMQRRGWALEFYGGVTNKFLRYCCGPWVSAITLGHTILGQDPDSLDKVRDHEWVHIRQYMRWGPLFIPAYVISSIIVWCQGKRAYRDNHFEREAYGD